MAEHRVPRITDREDEYRAHRRMMVISPERHDPFAMGKALQHLFKMFSILSYNSLALNVM